MTNDDERLAIVGVQLAELRALVGNRNYRGTHATTSQENQRRETDRALLAVASGAARRAAFLAELAYYGSARTRRHDRDATRPEPHHAIRQSVSSPHTAIAESRMADEQDDGVGDDDGLVEVDAAALYRREIERRRGTGKRILIPRETYERVYEGRATADEIAIARNRPVETDPAETHQD